jgi:hypothetical protein
LTLHKKAAGILMEAGGFLVGEALLFLGKSARSFTGAMWAPPSPLASLIPYFAPAAAPLYP